MVKTRHRSWKIGRKSGRPVLEGPTRTRGAADATVSVYFCHERNGICIHTACERGPTVRVQVGKIFRGNGHVTGVRVARSVMKGPVNGNLTSVPEACPITEGVTDRTGISTGTWVMAGRQWG